MTRFGYTLMTEQSGPRRLVDYAVIAERLGFDFEVSSDHHFPWLDTRGHTGYAWATLGAVAFATSSVELMTFVTCPTERHHPAVVAQKAATVGVLSEGRFVLGLGAGDTAGESVPGKRLLTSGERHDMLEEAVEIIRELLAGQRLTYDGVHYRVDAAKLWDLPDEPLEIGIALSGPPSVERFAPWADHLIAVEPELGIVDRWDAVRAMADLPPGRKIGQVAVSWGKDRDAAVVRAREQFGWSGGPDVSEMIPCGPDLDAIVAAVSVYWEAGFTDIAIVQLGDEDQQAFLDTAAAPLLRELRAAAPAA